MIKKIVSISFASAVFASSYATAWTSGDCSSSPTPCIKATLGTNNQEKITTPWQGNPFTSNDFNFRGTNVALGCGPISLNCTLSLTGQVSVDTAAYGVGIKVTGGSSTGGGLCGLVTFTPEWYAGENGLPPASYTSSSIIPLTPGAPLVGAMGHINFNAVLASVTNGVLDNVYYDNASKSFYFKGVFRGGNSAGCNIGGSNTNPADGTNGWARLIAQDLDSLEIIY